jgi:hypothetical protein
MTAKNLVKKLSAIKGISVSSHGTNWICISASVSLVIGDEITEKAKELEAIIPDGWQLEIGLHWSHKITRKCTTRKMFGRGW